MMYTAQIPGSTLSIHPRALEIVVEATEREQMIDTCPGLAFSKWCYQFGFYLFSWLWKWYILIIKQKKSKSHKVNKIKTYCYHLELKICSSRNILILTLNWIIIDRKQCWLCRMALWSRTLGSSTPSTGSLWSPPRQPRLEKGEGEGVGK